MFPFHFFFCGALGWAGKDQPTFELRPDLVAVEAGRPHRWFRLWPEVGVGTRGACSAHPAPLAGEWPRLQGCVSPAPSSLVAQALGGLV